tara:strand:+ start:327 stop:716 length:390 start_codon:yes stop_codon:yes gene_type:complete
MYTSIVDISDQNQENSDLETVLQDVIMLNDIQSDINELILEQGEKINIIDNNLKSTETTLERSNATLDETTKYKTKLKPIVIGAGLGLMCSLPITIPLYCTYASLGISVIGYSCIGGSVFGGAVGYKLA